MRRTEKCSTGFIGSFVKVAVISALALIGFISSSANEIWEFTPDDYLGESRILLICGAAAIPSEENWIGFVERDLIVFEGVDANFLYLFRVLDGEPIRGPILSSKRFDDIVKCTKKAEYFLIGKDTGVKKRWENTLPITDLFHTIDAMPMRKFEMRTRGAN